MQDCVLHSILKFDIWRGLEQAVNHASALVPSPKLARYPQVLVLTEWLQRHQDLKVVSKGLLLQVIVNKSKSHSVSQQHSTHT